MVYVFLGNGFEEVEALTPVDYLRRAGFSVTTVGLNGKMVSGSHNISIQADITIEELDDPNPELVILPGGLGGVASIRACQKAMDYVKHAYEAGAFVGAICAGPTVLADLGITEGKRAVCYPGCESQMGSAEILNLPAVQDHQLITGTSVGCAGEFALLLIEALGGRELSLKIRSQVVIR